MYEQLNNKLDSKYFADIAKKKNAIYMDFFPPKGPGSYF